MRLKLGLSSQILAGLIVGIACGLFFGDFCSRLSIAGDAFVGLALGGMEQRELLISQLDILAKVLVRVSGFVARLSPIGVFAIAASTAGTILPGELGRLQAYIVTCAAGALFLGFIVLPGLVATCTPLRYRDVLSVTKDAMIMAFATGKLIIVLPLLIEKTERLFERLRLNHDEDAVPAVDVLYPVAYSFPHVGKLLGGSPFH